MLAEFRENYFSQFILTLSKRKRKKKIYLVRSNLHFKMFSFILMLLILIPSELVLKAIGMEVTQFKTSQVGEFYSISSMEMNNANQYLFPNQKKLLQFKDDQFQVNFEFWRYSSDKYVLIQVKADKFNPADDDQNSEINNDVILIGVKQNKIPGINESHDILFVDAMNVNEQSYLAEKNQIFYLLKDQFDENKIQQHWFVSVYSTKRRQFSKADVQLNLISNYTISLTTSRSPLCPFNCSWPNGNCIDGSCVCSNHFINEDCSTYAYTILESKYPWTQIQLKAYSHTPSRAVLVHYFDQKRVDKQNVIVNFRKSQKEKAQIFFNYDFTAQKNADLSILSTRNNYKSFISFNQSNSYKHLLIPQESVKNSIMMISIYFEDDTQIGNFNQTTGQHVIQFEANLMIYELINIYSYWMLTTGMIFLACFIFCVMCCFAFKPVPNPNNERIKVESPSDKEKRIFKKLMKRFMPEKQFKDFKAEDPELANALNRTNPELNNCSICLMEMQDIEQVIRTICNHFFHQQCIEGWTNQNRNCPLCRQGFTQMKIREFILDKKKRQQEREKQIKLQEIMRKEKEKFEKQEKERIRKEQSMMNKLQQNKESKQGEVDVRNFPPEESENSNYQQNNYILSNSLLNYANQSKIVNRLPDENQNINIPDFPVDFEEFQNQSSSGDNFLLSQRSRDDQIVHQDDEISQNEKKQQKNQFHQQYYRLDTLQEDAAREDENDQLNKISHKIFHANEQYKSILPNLAGHHHISQLEESKISYQNDSVFSSIQLFNEPHLALDIAANSPDKNRAENQLSINYGQHIEIIDIKKINGSPEIQKFPDLKSKENQVTNEKKKFQPIELIDINQYINENNITYEFERGQSENLNDKNQDRVLMNSRKINYDDFLMQEKQIASNNYEQKLEDLLRKTKSRISQIKQKQDPNNQYKNPNIEMQIFSENVYSPE